MVASRCFDSQQSLLSSWKLYFVSYSYSPRRSWLILACDTAMVLAQVRIEVRFESREQLGQGASRSMPIESKLLEKGFEMAYVNPTTRFGDDLLDF